MATNLLEMITDAVGGQIVSQASKYLGESEDGTKSAVGMLLPALLSGLAKKGGTAEGAGSLLDTLTGSRIDSGLLGNLAGLFSGGSRTDSLVSLGTDLVKGLFGEKAGTLANTIATLTGLKSSSSSNLLYMAAPLVFGFLKKFVTEHGLDAAGLMRLLGEQTGFLKAGVDKRLAGALGIGDWFETSSPRTVEPPVRSAKPDLFDLDDEEPSWLRKLLPWLLAIAGAVATVLALRSCAPQQQGAVAPEKAAVPQPAPAVVAPPPPAVSPAPPKPSLAPPPMAASLPAKVYFAVGSAVLDDDSKKLIADVASGVKAQAHSVDITGYTDRTGNVAANMELAKRRAMAVKGALLAQGVPESKINMKPPLTVTGTTTGSGSNAEARRVEISKTP